MPAVLAKVENPRIVEARGAMDHFYTRLAQVVRGTSDRPLRIAIYGDSNMTMDYISGSLRRTLQNKFGDAGHGFVSFAQPWQWYRHMDVRHDVSKFGWAHYATSDRPVWDGHYGISLMCCESDTRGAWSSVGTADDGGVGRVATTFEVYYLKRPRAGAFAVEVDGARKRVVDTQATAEQATQESFEVPPGAHTLKVVVTRGHVRLLGATLENGASGVVVDTFGVGGLNYGQYKRVSAATRESMLGSRDYDLIVFLLGTNVYTTDERTAADIAYVVGLYRASLPNASLLLLSPPDAEDDGRGIRQNWSGRMRRNRNAIERAAQESGVAFWDLWASMGGVGSMYKFHHAGLADDDLIHFRKSGGAVLGHRFAEALLRGLRSFAETHPTVGSK